MKYWPTESGEYAVHVMCDDEDIEDSPFMAYIVPDNKANNSNQVNVVKKRQLSTFPPQLLIIAVYPELFFPPDCL